MINENGVQREEFGDSAGAASVFKSAFWISLACRRVVSRLGTQSRRRFRKTFVDRGWDTVPSFQERACYEASTPVSIPRDKYAGFSDHAARGRSKHCR